MKDFGLKIIDKNAGEVFECIDLVRRHDLALELGMYRGEKEPYLYLLQHPGPPKNFNVHFNHRDYSLFLMERHLQRLENDIGAAKRCGADYAVIHTFDNPMSPRPGYVKRLLDYLVAQASLMHEVLERLDFEVYLENTYHSLDFYRPLFERFIDANLHRIHFCFDIGHAKVWSRDRFDAWTAFLEWLQTQQRKLHFHLHANRGLADEHLAFSEAKRMGILEADGDFSSEGYIEMLRHLFDRFGEARKIFEVKNSLARENLLFLEAHGIFSLAR